MTALDGDPGQLHAAADRCLALAGECEGAANTLLGLLSGATTGWSGAAAVQFAAVGASHRRSLGRSGEALRSIGQVTHSFADALEEAQREQHRLQTLAGEGRSRLQSLHHRQRDAASAGQHDAEAALGRLIGDARTALGDLQTRAEEIERRMAVRRQLFARQLDRALPEGMLGDIEKLVATGYFAITVGSAINKVLQSGKLLVGAARFGPQAFGQEIRALEEPLAKLLRGPRGTIAHWSGKTGITRRLPEGLGRALETGKVAESPGLRRLLLEYEAAVPGINDLVRGRGHDGLRDAADRSMGLIEVGGVLMLRGPGWSKVFGAAAIASWAAWRIGGQFYDHKITVAQIGSRARLDASALWGSEAGQQQLAKDIRASKPVVRGIAAQGDDLIAGMVTGLTKVQRVPGIPNPMYDKLPKLSDHTDELLDKVTGDSLGDLFGRQAPPVITPPPLPQTTSGRPDPSRRITPPLRPDRPLTAPNPCRRITPPMLRARWALSTREFPVHGPSLLPRRQDVVRLPGRAW